MTDTPDPVPAFDRHMLEALVCPVDPRASFTTTARGRNWSPAPRAWPSPSGPASRSCWSARRARSVPMTEPPRGAAEPGRDPARPARTLGPTRLPFWVKAVIIACCVIEALLIAGALLGYPGLRFGAFACSAPSGRPCLTHGGLYPGQQIVMFVTYGFLHAGLLHLAMNMISLAALARELNRLIGPLRMALIYAAAQVAAALLFAVMQPQAGSDDRRLGRGLRARGRPCRHDGHHLRRRQQPTTPLVRAVALILGLNVALTVLMPSIAWEAHLGGAIAGIVLGLGFTLGRR